MNKKDTIITPEMNTFEHLISKVNNDDSRTKETATKAIKLVYQVSSRLALDIGNEFFLKCGSNVNLEEVEKMSMISNLGIPVPKVVKSWSFEGINFIMMEKVKGRLLNDIWDSLSTPHKRVIVDQAVAMINKMRRENKEGLVIVHGDFQPLNIIIDENSHKIAAIIDWETCSYREEEKEIEKITNHPDCPQDWVEMLKSSLKK
jgi:RIO-like serine/threonine protein kinase